MMNEEKFMGWFNDGINYYSLGEGFNGEIPPTYSMTSLLGLSYDELKPFTKDVLEVLERDDSFLELKLGYQAYFQFQDILNLSIESIDVPMENRHYCYFESLVYLRESLVSWLDKNVLAAITLLRPFLELTILHIYWYVRCEIDGYKHFYMWFRGEKNKPPFKNQVE